MKFNYRKIASIFASAVMLTSTIGFAAAANYPSPFSSGAAVVYGISAANTDVMAAVDVYANLKGSTTATEGTTVSSTGGDSTELSTSARKLYYADTINAAKSSLSATELPSVLSNSKFTDLSGTQYSYTQTIAIGPAAIKFGSSGGDLADPELYIDGGNNGALTNGWLYNYTLSLSKNLNVSDATNVQGQKINILGIDYVIGASSDNNTLYLYGSGETATVIGGEETKVTIAGTEHTVELVTTSSSTSGTLKVDGVSKSVVEGSSYAFAGNLNIYVKDVIHPSYAGDLRQAELIIGSNTLLLDNGLTVKQGADQTSVKTTLATVTASGNGQISGFSVAIAPSKTQLDSIKIGESFTDPVFGGMKIQFADVVPELTDTARQKVVVNSDNNQYIYATFTSARAGETGEKKLTIAYDNDTSTSAVSPKLAWTTSVNTNGKGQIHVLEGEPSLQNDWIVVNQGDAGTILSVDDISINTATEGTVTLSDVITGESQKITLTNTSSIYQKSGVNFFGGNGYTIMSNDAGTVVNITWSTAGTRTLFPRIKLKGGGWIAFLQQTTVSNASSVIFPDGLTTIATTGETYLNNTPSRIVNGINWSINPVNNAVHAILNPLCNFTSTLGPAVLIVEPKRWNDASYGNFICVPLTTVGSTTVVANPAQAVLNGTNSGFVALTSNTYRSQAVDQFGAFIDDLRDTTGYRTETITYPASQMYADVLFTAEATTVTPGTTGTASGGTIAIVKDTEVSSVSDKNLVVIGGSCINAAAAKILGSDTPLCADAFTEKTTVGAGQYIIKTVESPYNAEKIAMLVAGYNAADTETAVAKLLTGVSSDIGEKVYPEVSA
ncbi:MAG: hypothetical protein PHF67_02550 [Candidatus Nanoarchaeia archaeon]|nr:hypothetical protein [Candidatus Nanoarchaeia archaeon]